MAITAVYGYLAPDIAEFLEEAFERAGMDPLAIGNTHIESALRSIKFLTSEWLTYGRREFMIVQQPVALVAGTPSYDLPAGVVAAISVALVKANRATPLTPMSRETYTFTPDKVSQGSPSQYFQDKQYDKVQLTLWQTPNAADSLIVDCLRTMAQPGQIYNSLQVPPVAYEAFVAGLSMKLAQKFAPPRYDMLRVDYGGPRFPEKIGGKLADMLASTAGNADVRMF